MALSELYWKDLEYIQTSSSFVKIRLVCISKFKANFLLLNLLVNTHLQTNSQFKILTKKYQPIIHTDTTLHYATQQHSKKLFSPGSVPEMKILGFLLIRLNGKSQTFLNEKLDIIIERTNIGIYLSVEIRELRYFCGKF